MQPFTPCLPITSAFLPSVGAGGGNGTFVGNLGSLRGRSSQSAKRLQRFAVSVMDQGYSQNCRLAIVNSSDFDEEMEASAELWISSQHRLGESIIWHAAQQCYYWVDLLDPALYVHDPATGITNKQPLALPPPIGSIAATTDPSLLMLAHRDGLSLLDVRNLVMTPFCNPEAGRDAIIYNDIKVDRWARLWVGTSHTKEQEARGALWCVESNTRWALVDVGFAIANGPAFSLDGRTMYFNDSLGRTTYAYDIAPDHLAARNRRNLIEHPEADGLPDGIVVDSTGDIWTAQWAGSALLRFDSTGKLKTRHPVPSVHVTTLCFGGNDLDQVKITTATDGAAADALQRFPLSGSLFRLDCQTVGVAEPLFKIP